jgi:Restriction endonuclease
MNQISFDLHLLGWKAFEDLVACIFRDILGQTLQVFSEGPDGGRDAAFLGTSINIGGKTFAGSFAIQCKHTSKVAKPLQPSLVNDEFSKVTRLAALGLVDNYLLVTNHTLTGGVAEEIEAKLLTAGAKTAKIYGSEWIAQQIQSNPKLRRLVPRLYGLGDLTQIVTHQAYRQAREVLDSIAPDLACFVPTEAYRKCAHSLQEHGFVLLLGEPASGKTMIANLMALSAADEWDLETLMIASPEDFGRLWNPDDPGQFLWVDDAFGATQYDSNRVIEWNQQLPKLKAAIKVGARVVFTSRDYIFAAAKRDLKITAFELFDDNRVVIQVEKLTEIERQMILYSHLKSGSQSITFKSAVKPYLQEAVGVSKFLPEIARRFANPKFTAQLDKSAMGVKDFFEHPLKVLIDVIATLAAAEKAAIALVFIAGGKLAIPVNSDSQTSKALELLGVTLGQVKAALGGLDDSLMKRVHDTNREYWTFRHPTVRDAYASLVGNDPELIDVYLAGVTTEQLLNEVACGISTLQGIKIIVPPDRYGLVITRLRQFVRPAGQWNDIVKNFLGNRCSSEFLAIYYSENELISSLPSAIWYVSPSEVNLKILNKLQKAGILKEADRLALAKKVISICERDHSCKLVENSSVNELLTESEKSGTIQRVVNTLLTKGVEIATEIYDNWENDDDPEMLFDDIQNTLTFIEEDEQFSSDQKSIATNQLENIETLITKLKVKSDRNSYDSLDAEQATEINTISSRSIFDDVDE